VQEVRRAVEGIDDPEGVAVARLAAFLSQKGVTGVVFADQLDDLGLGRMVIVRDSRRLRLRMMTSPAARAAFTAILRSACTLNWFPYNGPAFAAALSAIRGIVAD
jgi:hypothetical protein